MADPYKRLRIDPEAPVPLASQLSNQLMWFVASGQIQPEEQLPPIRLLAQQLGINMHTVSAAYKLLEKNGVARTRQGRGTTVLRYDRAHLAGAIPDLPSFSIGVLIPSYNAFYRPFLEAIEASAEDEPLMFLVCNTRDDPQLVARWIDQLLSKHVDGILVASKGLPQDISLAERWGQGRGLPPVVFVDIPDSPEPRLLFDHFQGGRLAAEHLLGHEFDQPLVLTPPLEWSNVAELFEGFTQTYQQAGHPIEAGQLLQVADFEMASGSAAIERLLKDGERPQAIFAAGDHLAVGALRSLDRHGVQVPQEIALIGYGGSEPSELVRPPMTSVRLDTATLGREAMSMLRARMDGEATETEERLSVDLLVRRSCGCSIHHD